MRWEYLTLLVSLCSFGWHQSGSGIHFKFKILALFLSLYGPLYTLLNFKIGDFPLSFSLLTSLYTLVLTFHFLKPRLATYFFFVFIVCIIPSLLFFNPSSLLRTLQYLLVCLSGLCFGSFLLYSRSGVRTFLLTTKITLSSLLPSLLLKYLFFIVFPSNQFTIRDTGYGISVVTCALLNYRIKAQVFPFLSASLYLLVIQTRSLLVSFWVSFLLAIRSSAIRARRSLISVVCILILSSFIVVFVRTFLEGAPLDSASSVDLESLFLTSSITRVNGAFLEYQTFLSNPLFGLGPFYYFESYIEYTQIAKVFGDQAYAAFNHFGYTACLAQTGLIGFSVIILLPLSLLLFYVLSPRNRLNFACNPLSIIPMFSLPAYFILFFGSGSPLASEFQVSFYFYLNVSVLFLLSRLPFK